MSSRSWEERGRNEAQRPEIGAVLRVVVGKTDTPLAWLSPDVSGTEQPLLRRCLAEAGWLLRSLDTRRANTAYLRTSPQQWSGRSAALALHNRARVATLRAGQNQVRSGRAAPSRTIRTE
jgi:hypothetical protein